MTITISAFELIAFILAVAVIAIMSYGFGWCDGRDSMRKDIKHNQQFR